MTKWNEASQGNDASPLSGMKIPNQHERDIAQNAMDNADADKGAAEHDKCKTCGGSGEGNQVVQDRWGQVIGGQCPDCWGRGVTDKPRLEDVVSGTTRPNETAKGWFYRQINTWLVNEGFEERFPIDAIRDLSAHLAGNLFPDADKQPKWGTAPYVEGGDYDK